MDVVLLTPDWERAWERFIEASPHATFAHSLGWRNVVERTYHHMPYYLTAIRGETVTGVLPLFLIRSPFFGRFLVTAPYLSHGGLLAEDEAAARALIKSARELALREGARYVEIRGLSQVNQGLLLKDKYCTFLLPLHSGPEVLWAKFEGRARKAVRKAQKSGLLVERGHHLVEAFDNVMSRHMRDLGTPFHRTAFYQNILAEFPTHSEILVVCHKGRYIGGLLLVTFRDTVFPLYGGALAEFRVFSPMSLLIWETIRYGSEKGFALLDLGRSRWGSGTFVFKRQWRARPFPLFYEYHLADGVKMPDLDPTNPRFRLAITVWRRLPLFMAKGFGPVLIRGIP